MLSAIFSLKKRFYILVIFRKVFNLFIFMFIFLWETHSVQHRTCLFFCNVNRVPIFFQQCTIFEYKIPSAPGMPICALTNQPATRSVRMFALTTSSYCPSFNGRQQGECGKTLSLLLYWGYSEKAFLCYEWCFRSLLSPISLLKWRPTFAGPFSIAYQIILALISGVYVLVFSFSWGW